MTQTSKYLFLFFALTLLITYKSLGQISKDTSACLTRFTVGNTTFFKIPMTKYCFVKEAGIKTDRDWPGGWVMKWDVAKKYNSNLLFLEMNSTDVEGWLGNEDLSGSVQLVFELPEFSDSLKLKGLNYKAKGLSIINNYGGGDSKKEYLNGEIRLIKISDKVFISSSLNLVTEHPNTKQQFILDNNQIPSLTFDQYQELENKVDSTRKAENDLMVNALTESISERDSLWEIESNRIKDLLKLHHYTGKFRFWISELDKAEYSRMTYSISNDSLIIKKGPYDFIYLAKNYPRDSVYFKRKLTEQDRKILMQIENRVETDSINNSYNNFCIIDGQILTFSFESSKFSKDVTVSNYYNETIAYVLSLVNKLTPKKYQFRYDKGFLNKLQSDCDK